MGGGALYVMLDSNVLWIGTDITFIANTAYAEAGGAIAVLISSVSWSGGTKFG